MPTTAFQTWYYLGIIFFSHHNLQPQSPLSQLCNQVHLLCFWNFKKCGLHKKRKMWASLLSELSLSDVASWSNAFTISSLNLHNSEGWVCIVYIEQSETQSQKSSARLPSAWNSLTPRTMVFPHTRLFNTYRSHLKEFPGQPINYVLTDVKCISCPWRKILSWSSSQAQMLPSPSVMVCNKVNLRIQMTHNSRFQKDLIYLVYIY